MKIRSECTDIYGLNPGQEEIGKTRGYRCLNEV